MDNEIDDIERGRRALVEKLKAEPDRNKRIRICRRLRDLEEHAADFGELPRDERDDAPMKERRRGARSYRFAKWKLG